MENFLRLRVLEAVCALVLALILIGMVIVIS